MIQNHAFGGELVEVGRVDVRIAEAAHGVIAMLVRHEEEDVGAARSIKRRGGAGSDEAAAGEGHSRMLSPETEAGFDGVHQGVQEELVRFLDARGGGVGHQADMVGKREVGAAIFTEEGDGG